MKETQDEAENAPAAAKGLEEELRTERRTPGQNEAQQQPVSSPVGSPYGTLLKLEFAFAASTHVGRRVCYRPADEAEWRAARVLSYDARGGTSGSWRGGMTPRQAPKELRQDMALHDGLELAGRSRRVDGRGAQSRAPGGGAAAVRRHTHTRTRQDTTVTRAHTRPAGARGPTTMAEMRCKAFCSWSADRRASIQADSSLFG